MLLYSEAAEDWFRCDKREKERRMSERRGGEKSMFVCGCEKTLKMRQGEKRGNEKV